MSGSLAIISNKVGLDRGGGDIGFNSPAVRAELNFVKLEVKELREVWPLMGGVNSMSIDGFSNSNCWQIMQSAMCKEKKQSSTLTWALFFMLTFCLSSQQFSQLIEENLENHKWSLKKTSLANYVETYGYFEHFERFHPCSGNIQCQCMFPFLSTATKLPYVVYQLFL